jgi:hypothetical protein
MTTQSWHGAPLDAAKLPAAAAMLVDHTNIILLKSAYPLCHAIGRVAFPLFCFALACHLAAGADSRRYVARLLVVGAVTQPVFAWAFPQVDFGNVLFTLAIGVAIAEVLRRQSALWQHLALAAGAITVLAFRGAASTGVDFGLAGMLFPAALFLVLNGSPSHAIWLVLLAAGLNIGGEEPISDDWLKRSALDFVSTTVGALVVLIVCKTLEGRRRFLPRYALYAFYPLHIAALAFIRAVAL